jgi:hypothetical protein
MNVDCVAINHRRYADIGSIFGFMAVIFAAFSIMMASLGIKPTRVG